MPPPRACAPISRWKSAAVGAELAHPAEHRDRARRRVERAARWSSAARIDIGLAL